MSLSFQSSGQSVGVISRFNPSVRGQSQKLDRLRSTVFLTLFAVLFYIVYRDYVSVEWGYTGLRFGNLSGAQMTGIGLCIAAQGWAMPQYLNTPSSVIMWMLTALFYVPTMVITIMIGERNADQYYGQLFALTIAMITVSTLSGRAYTSSDVPIPPLRFYLIFMVIFAAFSALLIYQYEDIMYFSSVEDVYFQRFAASDMETLSIMGYIRTYYLYLLSCLLFAAGLLRRQYWVFTAIGLFGYLITYLIDASKIAFVIPILMTAFVLVHRFAKSKAWVLSAGIGLVTMLSGLLVHVSSVTKLMADLVVVRSIAIPAQTFAQYSDVFAARGYTYWSHVRGLSSIVPPPDSFAADPKWPVLGQIVGSTFFDAERRVNLNANLFAGEGIAAAGWVGVIVIALFLAIFLRAIDFAAKGWNQAFVILISVPLGMSLSNTHLSTFLLSFGGLFWLVLLYFYKPNRS